MGPPIVLIGGTAGCGKTSLASRLDARFDFDHRIGTGFIRAVLQSEVDPALEPSLFKNTYETCDPVSHLRAQARRVQGAVQSCVARARAEGTSLVVEGSHLLPELYHGEGVPFIVLQAPPEPEHWRRLNGPRHSRRPMGRVELGRCRQIGEFYLEDAARHGVPAILYEDNFEEVVAALFARA